MESEPSFLSRLFEFGSALLPYFFVLATSGIGPALIIAFAAKYQDRFRLLKPIANRAARPWIILAILAIGFGYASFSAFDDVNSRLRTAQKEAAEAKGKGSVEQQRAIDKLGTDLAAAQRQIEELKLPKRDPNWLYQDGAQVAMVGQTQSDPQRRIVAFPVVTANRELNMHRPFYFLDWQLICAGSPGASMIFGASQQINYQDFICRIEADAK
jgi:hypothetical protein